MSIFQKIKRVLTDRDYRFMLLSERGFYRNLPDREFIERIFHARMGYDLDLENPKTYNEKLQWLKLYDREPLYQTLVDKFEVKKWVADRIGEEYIIPTLGVWDRFDDIDFSKLPQSFVLKCTHDSGGLVIVKDKSNMDIKSAKATIEHCLKQNYYYHAREWPYKDVKPRIIAEEYMEDASTEELRDYKFFCFDGEAKALFVACDRQVKGEETKFDFFDMDFRHLDFRNGHPNSKKPIEKPVCFEEMRRLAQILSKGIPQVRVDFYEVNGRVYFGEMTFFHWSGLTPFDPPEWDNVFGSWIKLPNMKKPGTKED